MWWLIRDVMAHRRCVGSQEMWWLIRRCGGSLGHVVAHRRCGGSLGDVVAYWSVGVVAH